MVYHSLPIAWGVFLSKYTPNLVSPGDDAKMHHVCRRAECVSMRLPSKESTTSLMELIPEFFILPAEWSGHPRKPGGGEPQTNI